jgi:hypothetical protein
MSLKIPFPPHCAWCGMKYPRLTHTIRSREEKVNHYIIYRSKQITNYEFDLPICEQCKAEVERKEAIFHRMSYIGPIGGLIIGMAIGAVLQNLGVEITYLIFPGLIGLFLGSFFGSYIYEKIFLKKNWGRVNNGHLEFDNPVFKQAFIDLMKSQTKPEEEVNTISKASLSSPTTD